MKTHELARALALLARMLKAGPDLELKDWQGPRQATANGTSEPTANGDTAADAGLALSVLAALSRYSKSQWRSLIAEWHLPVEVRNPDSVRDVLGRLLNYLEVHPDAAQRIVKNSTKKSTKASPELVRALEILLGQRGGAAESAEDEE